MTITGPRQAGKTTLAKDVFSSHTYVNLEQPDIRQLAQADPKAFFDRFKPPVILDEFQRVPDLLSWIQVMADESIENGQFILTGSNQFQIGESVTQSLAGRTALLKLLPFSIQELKSAGIELSRDEYIAKGFLPRIYDKGIEHFKAYGFYMETYVERDVRQQIKVKNIAQFKLFLKLLAGRIGQILNLHSLSRDVGVSSVTLGEWLSVLEASYIVHKVVPYYKNFGKRMIKSPKIYFTEIGLAAWLLGIETPEQASRDPLLGGLFENLVVNEIVKSCYNRGRPADIYFYRDSNGNEVDLILELGENLIPVEIKAAMTWNDGMPKGIKYLNKIAKNTGKGIVIYSGDLEFENDAYRVMNFKKTDSIFQ